jgi:hypothetical protein
MECGAGAPPASRTAVILRRAEGAPRDRTPPCVIYAVKKATHSACSVCTPIDLSGTARPPKVPHAGSAAVQDDNALRVTTLGST